MDAASVELAASKQQALELQQERQLREAAEKTLAEYQDELDRLRALASDLVNQQAHWNDKERVHICGHESDISQLSSVSSQKVVEHSAHPNMYPGCRHSSKRERTRFRLSKA
jgi:hypothetical protein